MKRTSDSAMDEIYSLANREFCDGSHRGQMATALALRFGVGPVLAALRAESARSTANGSWSSWRRFRMRLEALGGPSCDSRMPRRRNHHREAGAAHRSS